MKLSHLAAIALSGAFLAAVPALAKKYPDLSEDGLERTKSKRVDALYWSPDADLSRYQRVHIADIEVEFRDNWQRDQNRSRRGTTDRVTDEHAEEIRTELARDMRDIFTEELEAGGYSVVEDSGADVLLLQPSIVELDVFAPDVRQKQPGRGSSFTEQPGRMTLNLDLADSSSQDVLGRMIDQRGGRTAHVQRTNSVTNRAEAQRVLRSWATYVRETLDEARAVN